MTRDSGNPNTSREVQPPRAVNPHADLFEDWLRDHPAPDLQALVAHWGRWEKIPQIAWDDFTRRNEEWEQARLRRLYGAETAKALQQVGGKKKPLGGLRPGRARAFKVSYESQAPSGPVWTPAKPG